MIRQTILLFLLAVSARSIASAQVNNEPVEDLDAAALDSMREKLGCKSASTKNAKLACEAIDAFERGKAPEADGKRLVGVGITGPDHKLDLVVYLYKRSANIHESVNRGDQVAVSPIVPTSKDETAAVTAAAASLVDGKLPATNEAFKYAQTLNLDTRMSRTREIKAKGKSLAIESKRGRMLARRHDKTLVILEVADANRDVKEQQFWINVFRH